MFIKLCLTIFIINYAYGTPQNIISPGCIKNLITSPVKSSEIYNLTPELKKLTMSVCRVLSVDANTEHVVTKQIGVLYTGTGTAISIPNIKPEYQNRLVITALHVFIGDEFLYDNNKNPTLQDLQNSIASSFIVFGNKNYKIKKLLPIKATNELLYDLVIVVLDSDISSEIPLIPIQPSTDVLAQNQQAIYAGYGSNHNNLPSFLFHACKNYLKNLAADEILNAIQGYYSSLGKLHIHEIIIDTVQENSFQIIFNPNYYSQPTTGDSGGPVFIKGEHNIYSLAGTISTNRSHINITSPAVYAAIMDALTTHEMTN